MYEAAGEAKKAIADAIKQNIITQGTQEYYDALKRINEIAKPYYVEAGLPPPAEVQGDVIPVPVKEPSFFDRFKSSPKAVTSTPVGSNVPASATPPEVQKILDKYK